MRTTPLDVVPGQGAVTDVRKKPLRRRKRRVSLQRIEVAAQSRSQGVGCDHAARFPFAALRFGVGAFDTPTALASASSPHWFRLLPASSVAMTALAWIVGS